MLHRHLRQRQTSGRSCDLGIGNVMAVRYVQYLADGLCVSKASSPAQRYFIVAQVLHALHTSGVELYMLGKDESWWPVG